MRTIGSGIPIRYAKTAMIKRLEIVQEEILKPFHWFLDRWEDKLAKMGVNRSDLEAHLTPGHKERFGVVVRFIYPEAPDDPASRQVPCRS